MGVRYAFMQGRRERGDIEIDGTYESWKQAEGTGDPLKVPALGPFVDISATILHHYKDTGSVRVGGAYNHYFKNDMRLTARAGLFYDSAATRSAYTRLDFDTLDKIGVGLGLGFHIRGVTINAAYNYIASPERTVTDGRLQVLNGTNGSTQLGNGDPTPVVNNGTYTSATQLISLGLSVDFDEALKSKQPRKDPFGDPDMPGWGRTE
jgi:long-subunit fatty acid transport protein